VTTVAGGRGQAGNTDGTATAARFSAPGKLAVDQDGTLYVAANYAVRKVAPDGTVSTFAGRSGEHGQAAGNGPQARFAYPVSVALGGGNVFVAQGSNITNLGGGDVRKFSRQGVALPYGANPNGVVAVSAPVDIAADSQGNVFVASNGADQPGPGIGSTYRSIEMLAVDGRSRTTIAGATSDVRTVDGPGASARFMDPQAIATGPGGRLVVAEAATNAIRAIDGGAARTVTTLAGGAAGGYVDGPVGAARFNGPSGLSATPDGTLFVADTRNNVLRRITPAGAVSTVAVTFPGGGGFNLPVAVAAGAGTTVYALDTATAAGRQVHAIDSAGRATGFYSAGPDAAAIAADAAANLYVGEAGRLTVVTPAGGARVLAAGISARGLAVDSAGNVYFSDDGTVGVVDPAGRVTVRAGRAGLTGDANGTGGDARFNRPGALALDAAGNLYVADGLKIRKVTPPGVVTLLADVATLDGVQQVASGGQAPAVTGLAWVGGTLYGIVQNALIAIAPVH
jgi:sugar lactone lactonase YvrE